MGWEAAEGYYARSEGTYDALVARIAELGEEVYDPRHFEALNRDLKRMRECETLGLALEAGLRMPDVSRIAFLRRSDDGRADSQPDFEVASDCAQAFCEVVGIGTDHEWHFPAFLHLELNRGKALALGQEVRTKPIGARDRVSGEALYAGLSGTQGEADFLVALRNAVAAKRRKARKYPGPAMLLVRQTISPIRLEKVTELQGTPLDAGDLSSVHVVSDAGVLIKLA